MVTRALDTLISNLLDLSIALETTIALVTSCVGFAVGISVLVKDNASTHALTELLILAASLNVEYHFKLRGTGNEADENEIRWYLMRLPNLAHAALLDMLALEVFGIYIADSKDASRVLAVLNIVNGVCGAASYCTFWYNQRFGGAAAENEVTDIGASTPDGNRI